MNRTSISYCDLTSNPIYAVDKETGKRGWFCTKVSAGCENCYSATLNKRFGNSLEYIAANRDRIEWRLNERELAAILRRQEPAHIFMMDMGDLFHEDVPDGFIDRVFAVTALAPQHTMQYLTKRPERMRRYFRSNPVERIAALVDEAKGDLSYLQPEDLAAYLTWPLPNVWLGVTAENQPMADKRLPILLETPAAHRFVSLEPLLSGLDVTPWLRCQTCGYSKADAARWMDHTLCRDSPIQALDQVIAGGESGGPPERALVERCACKGQKDGHDESWSKCGHDSYGAPIYGAYHPKPEALEWVRSLRDQCAAAGVPFHWKQWGGPRPTSAGHRLDGREERATP